VDGHGLVGVGEPVEGLVERGGADQVVDLLAGHEDATGAAARLGVGELIVRGQRQAPERRRQDDGPFPPPAGQQALTGRGNAFRFS
jgi:hypothetical protein